MEKPGHCPDSCCWGPFHPNGKWCIEEGDTLHHPVFIVNSISFQVNLVENDSMCFKHLDVAGIREERLGTPERNGAGFGGNHTAGVWQ